MNSEVPGILRVTSTAFEEGGFIPSKYTCDGRNVNPPLQIGDIPEAAKCLALIIEDPDAARITWVHWVLWNIPPSGDIREDSKPGVQGVNDFGRIDYGGPCPPSGAHRYFFKVFALDQMLSMPSGSRKKELERAMSGHILAKGELMGKYERK